MTAVTKPEGEPTGTAVATTQRREMTIKDLPAYIIGSPTAKKVIAPFLPEGVSLERVAAAFRIAVEKDDAAWKAACAKDSTKSGDSPLQRCTPMSVFMAVAKICHWGLEIGETAHLVPFGAECTPVADYKGLAQLVIASGLVRSVESHCVYANEPFKIIYGTSMQIHHEMIGSPKSRGALVGAYALFKLRGYGDPVVRYLDVEEIDAIRKRHSKQWKDGPLKPWYAEKTVVRQGVKLLPKDPRLAKTLAAFDDMERAELELAVPEQLRTLEAGEPVVEVKAPSGPAPVMDAGYGWDLDDDEPAERD